MSMVFAAEYGNIGGVMDAGSGTVQVLANWASDIVTFIESAPNGAIQTTSIYGATFGDSWAVHSRTTDKQGLPKASQWYGKCHSPSESASMSPDAAITIPSDSMMMDELQHKKNLIKQLYGGKSVNGMYDSESSFSNN